jgi:hypothetical protein
VQFHAVDIGLENADLLELIPFNTANDSCVLETARLLTINFVHCLKSPVIVTPSFLGSLVSFIKSQPKRKSEEDESSNNNNEQLGPLDEHYIVDCMSSLDTIRALCIAGMFNGLYRSVQTANYIIKVRI